MKKLVAVSVMTWLCHIGSASAGVPDWCKDASFNDRYDLADLSKKEIDDADDVIATFAAATCKPTPEATANKADIEKARQAWGKKLGMSEADWADAVAFANAEKRPESAKLSSKDVAAMTAVDQYRVIREGISKNGSPFDDAFYLADMFEPNLTEVGRLGLIEECTRTDRLAVEDEAVPYAICQGDIDAFDLAKFATQLRSDTAHPGDVKMALRLRAYALPSLIKEHAANIAKIYAKDEAYKKLWDAAKAGRAEWAKMFGGNTAGLALAQKLDTAQFFDSRKAFDGCEATTTAALNAAVTAKVSPKLFKDLKDVRMDPFAGVAKGVGPAILDIPEVAFAAGPYIICHKNRGIAEFLSYFIDNIPGHRGPRRAAFTRITKEKVILDDMTAQVRYPSWRQPFSRSHGSISSAGGVIKTIKLEDNVLVVGLEKLIVKRYECQKSHRTNRISRINNDGSLSYEEICDKMGYTNHDETWDDFKINKAYQSVLKKGVLFSSVNSEGDAGADVLAIWPKKDAPFPTMVLGAPVK